MATKPVIALPRAQRVVDKDSGQFTRPYEDQLELVFREVQNLSNAIAGVDTLSGSASLSDVITTLNTIISTMKAG